MAQAQPIDVVEMEEQPEVAATLGFRCSISVSKRLGDPALVLRRLRDLLVATTADPGFEAFRAVALRGEDPADVPAAARGLLDAFLVRVRAGIGGLSEGGRFLAVSMPGDVMALFAIKPSIPRRAPPRILVTPGTQELGLGHLRLLARVPVVLK